MKLLTRAEWAEYRNASNERRAELDRISEERCRFESECQNHVDLEIAAQMRRHRNVYG